MVLTEKQKQDLHLAILDYFDTNPQFQRSAAVFREESTLGNSSEASAVSRSGLLEKKWTSVVRLQRKILDLEERLKQAEDDAKLSSAGVVSRSGVLGVKSSQRLPRAPCRTTITGHRSPLTCVVFHPVFSVFATASEDGTVKIWDFESGEFERTLKGHTNTVNSIAFSLSGDLLASASTDLTIKIWDFSADGAYECLKTLRGHDHNVSAVIFLPSGDKLVSCSRDNTIRFWEVSTGYCLRTLSKHTDWVRCLSVNASGSMLASSGNDQTIMVWDVETYNVISLLKDHDHVIHSIDFSPASADKYITSKTAQGTTSAMTNEQEDIDSSSVTGGVDGLYLVSGSRDKTVKVWSILQASVLMTFRNHENWVRSVQFHPSGKFVLSSAEDKTIRIFDLSTGRCIRTLEEAHSHFVVAIAMHPTLPMLVSGSVDKTVKIWDCV